MSKLTASVFAALAVPLLFSTFVWLTNRGDWDSAGIVVVAILLLVATVTAHLFLSIPGKVSCWALPLGWALCLLPNYYFSHYVISAGFLGPSFAFDVIAMLFILPSGVVAAILAIIQAIRMAIRTEPGSH